MPAIDVSASIFCARERSRGTASIASTVTLRAFKSSISCGFCAGQMKEISVWPAFISAASSALGARTLKTMSALDHRSAAVGAIVAPAATKASS
jgi:hypothetical protein